MSDYYIAHHGILGMKWGIRRFQPYSDGKKGRFVGKVRSAGEKIKETVQSEEFKQGAKTVAKVAAIGTAAALGTAFITSPQGQALMHTAISKAAELIEGFKENLYNRAEESAAKANAYLDEKFGEDFHSTDASLADLDRKIKQTELKLDAENAKSIKTLKEDASLGEQALQNAATSLQKELEKNGSVTQEQLQSIAEKTAESYLSEQGITDEQIAQGMAIAEDILKKMG